MSRSISDGTLTVSFPVAKERIRRFNFDEPVCHTVYKLYVSLAEFKGKSIPEGNNPRSHEDPNNVAKNIMREIKDTLLRNPDQFGTVNRGGLVIAQSASYNPKDQMLALHLTDWKKRKVKGETIRPRHGLADGGTTDLVIHRLQQEGYDLSEANLPLEIMVFGEHDDPDKGDISEFIQRICEARNTSRQVSGWSMAEWRGDWNWLKEVLDPIFPNKIAYNEYGSGEVTVLDILAILNLFRSVYDGKKVPTISYSSKGRMMSKFKDNSPSFKALKGVVLQILNLHDYIYSTFNKAYAGGTKKSLRRYQEDGTRLFHEYDSPRDLTFSHYKAKLEIDKGLLFPVLAAFQALLDFDGESVEWFTEPKAFWDEHGTTLLEQLVDAMMQHKKNPQSVGKDANVYRYLWGTVHSIRRDEEMKRLKAELAKKG